MTDPGVSIFGLQVPVVVALIALGGTILAAIVVPIINSVLVYRNATAAALATAEVARLLKLTSEKTDKKLDDIFKLSDGRLTEAQNDIKRLERRLFEKEGADPPGAETTSQVDKEPQKQ